MRRLLVAVAIAGAAILGVAPSAVAAPPHGTGGHVHHVHVGNGGCVQIDAVAFLAESRGLHQGANASGVEKGVWHGPCH
jgi:hypothetical protein